MLHLYDVPEPIAYLFAQNPDLLIPLWVIRLTAAALLGECALMIVKLGGNRVLAAGIGLYVLYTLLCAVAGVEGRLTIEAGLANVAILMVAIGLRRTVTKEQGDIERSGGFLQTLVLTVRPVHPDTGLPHGSPPRLRAHP